MAGPADSLLLLPSPPSPLNHESLSAAYRPSLTRVISQLKGLPISSKLFILVPYLSLQTAPRTPRVQVYAEIQKIFAGLYGLLCLICTELDVNEYHDAGFIDPRIILISDDKDHGISTVHASTKTKFSTGPLIDLSTFALTRRQWNLIFSVDGEQGQSFIRTYQSLANQISPPIEGQIHLVRGGLSLIQKSPETLSKHTLLSSVHNVVAVGGTFDNLHAGHKLLLTATALLLQPTSVAIPQPKRLIVGITGDDLLKNKKYAEYMMSWKRRQDDVIDFLVSILLFTRSSATVEIETTSFNEPGPNGHAIHTRLKSASITIECVEISDPYGPTITDESVTALIVSGETRSGGKAVNDKRLEKGWEALEVFEVDVLDAQQDATRTEEFASKISSTAIRKRLAEEAKS